MSTLTGEAGGRTRLVPIPFHTPKFISCCKLLGPIESYLIHWLNDAINGGGRSTPCTHEGCMYCTGGNWPRLNWYAAAFLHDQQTDRWMLVILSINKSYMESLQTVENPYEVPLVFRATKDYAKGRQFKVTPTNRVLPPPFNPEPIDVAEQLELAWRVPRRLWATSHSEADPTPNILRFNQTHTA
ncbi:MAG: hypothetical protein ACJ8C4_00510 [Gemmataceae bacterium]